MDASTAPDPKEFFFFSSFKKKIFPNWRGITTFHATSWRISCTRMFSLDFAIWNTISFQEFQLYIQTHGIYKLEEETEHTRLVDELSVKGHDPVAGLSVGNAGSLLKVLRHQGVANSIVKCR